MRVKRPDPDQWREAVDGAAATDLALQAMADSGRRVVASPADIYRAATLGDERSLDLVMAAGADQPEVWAAFDAQLRATATATFAPLRAADTGDADTREAPGFGIEIRPSSQRPGRCFLFIRLDEGRSHPKRLFVRRGDDWSSLALGPAQDNLIQMTLDESHPIITKLRDRDAEIILK